LLKGVEAEQNRLPSLHIMEFAIMKKMPVKILSNWCGVFLLLLGAISGAAADPIKSQFAEINGVRLHYLSAGKGEAVLLLHGYAENSHMWRPLIAELAKDHTVIAPDLPGIGESAIPASGLDVISAAVSMHALVRSLGIEKAEVVGHDIGLMVAYAYAVQFPTETQKLVVMDAFIPGVAGWEAVYQNPDLWHFTFHGPTPEALVLGRERIYFEHYWNDFAADGTRSLSEADRKLYTAAYAKPGYMRAGWSYFTEFPNNAKRFAELSKTKLPMPVLSIGGEESLGEVLGKQMQTVSTNVHVIVLKDAGHWIMEEKPKETMDALLKFL
jgi:pimeloyl-ACP methyl ester carboxylesterase